MQDVRVIGVESGSLLLATDGGSEFRLPVTSALPGQVRQANPDGTPHKRVSPKDVQARIRGGADAVDVAAALDVDVEYVRRFEGPVLAERAFILDAARRVPVTPTDDGAPDVFGEAISARLEAGSATTVSWSSWKHVENGWTVQVRYTATEVEHDAQWHFDPKTSTLTPENGDAHRLSHTEDDGIAPRLRAVESTEQDTDGTRFDSGAFRVEEPDESVTNPDVAERAPLRALLPRIGSAQIEERAPGNETADLLEALRRRRGERESVAFAEQPHDESRGSVSVVDIPLQGFEDTNDTSPQPDARPSSAPEPENRKKRSRRSMPSWDEIVFGTRPDDDLA
ncbi:septation protein SepH [Curtobacterium sp. VKM Ac-2922]|uniref:septation protein SepH n=1 Tax=Curtobacterium sp. VKM Ac-2922 TaxID=2929475 RepID=UPI001FB48F30|nr:septation protein SepH [Curtobacterium sp. VKM Ac-2922]MCJ1715445.1 septation protein SepH [Curtobacterium sp. VKM Ac-2922]